MKQLEKVTWIVIFLVFISGCDLISPPQSMPAAATDSKPKATALSALPATWTLAPTLTPTITFTPSVTPLPPTATPNWDNFDISAMMTPAAATQLPDPPSTSDWKRITSQTASLLIPPTYEVIDLGETFGAFFQAFFEGFSEAFSEFAEDITEEMDITPEATTELPEMEELPEFDLLMALDEAATTSAVLSSEERSASMSTEDMINQALTGLDTEFSVIRREVVENSQLPAERVVVDHIDLELGPRRDMVYGILGDNYAWTLIFSSPKQTFPTNLLVFETIASSLTPLK